jgi:hypothetical protein
MEVCVDVVRINGDDLAKTSLRFFEIASRKIVIPKIVQDGGGPRRKLPGAVVEMLRLWISPLGIKNDAHQAQRRKVARISTQGCVEGRLRICNSAFLNIFGSLGVG